MIYYSLIFSNFEDLNNMWNFLKWKTKIVIISLERITLKCFLESIINYLAPMADCCVEDYRLTVFDLFTLSNH